ncbi:MAG: aldehyde dehydrogenase family protein [Acidobacteriota bacterium]
MTQSTKEITKNVQETFGLGDTCSGAFAGRWLETTGEVLESTSPATGDVLGRVQQASTAELEETVRVTEEAFREWRTWPAPKRGEVVRLLGEELRSHKDALGALVTLEMGKIRSEGLGEVQEMIDMADLAVGMSRQLYGKTMHSERPDHRMYEQWHPLGTIGIITAFNFPVAVWAWNAMVAAACGDSMIWKPSWKTPLTAIATTKIAQRALEACSAPPIFNLVIGTDREIGETMIADERLPLISATGSTRMGRRVAQVVAGRMGRSLLELGGNNAMIVMADADLDLATRAITFGAAGTAGQRCTTTRRLFVHSSIAEELTRRLVSAYGSVKVGDPLQDGVLMGPLIDHDAVDGMQSALAKAKDEGGEVLFGGGMIDGPGHYVEPTLVRAKASMPITCEETFAPILYIMEFDGLDEVIEQHNSVPQGLSSAIFTDSVKAAEQFLSSAGSDCGIANVNIGTSGAEIGGAFGGEKDTGGGREAGSDAWKLYMRRQTCTINHGDELPLAQGVEFDV